METRVQAWQPDLPREVMSMQKEIRFAGTCKKSGTGKGRSKVYEPAFNTRRPPQKFRQGQSSSWGLEQGNERILRRGPNFWHTVVKRSSNHLAFSFQHRHGAQQCPKNKKKHGPVLPFLEQACPARDAQRPEWSLAYLRIPISPLTQSTARACAEG